jgi:hypothetical protein
VLLCSTCLCLCAGEEPKKDAPKPPAPEANPESVLGMLAKLRKQAAPLEAELSIKLRNGDTAAAEQLCHKLIEEVPFAPNGYYNLGCILALRGQKDAAFEQLYQSAAHGFSDVAHIQADPDLVTLHDDPRFAELLKKSRAATPMLGQQIVKPYVVTSREAWVEESNVSVDRETGLLRTEFKFEIPNADKLPIAASHAPAGALLLQWQKEGTAAGHVGDLYDNRDGDHSDLNRALFPQLTWIEHSEPAKQLGIHWGIQDKIVHPGIVLGNASVAQTGGPFWRSMPRMACGNQHGAALLYWQYTHNKLYAYPCHVDHSPGRDGKLGDKNGGHGDVYPANTPYLIASQGSSGTDQVFLQAVAATLAAFRPEVKKKLADAGAVWPTVQMIFRMSNKTVKTEADYLTGIAHPTAFQGSQVDAEKMVRAAHALTADSLPPLVRIKVIKEDQPVNGRDFFDPHGTTEAFFDTPCAIARIWRGSASQRRLVISAEDSIDLNKKPLTFRWAVLQGDPAKTIVKPLNKDGSQAELTITYQTRRPIREGEALESNRVDIGVFAYNGAQFSAPAFVTFFTSDNETREYAADGRVLKITYMGRTHYVDPVVFLPRVWRDEYHYEAGKLTGWTRWRGDKSEEFNADGMLLSGEQKQKVRYVAKMRSANEPPVLEEVIEK